MSTRPAETTVPLPLHIRSEDSRNYGLCGVGTFWGDKTEFASSESTATCGRCMYFQKSKDAQRDVQLESTYRLKGVKKRSR